MICRLHGLVEELLSCRFVLLLLLTKLFAAGVRPAQARSVARTATANHKGRCRTPKSETWTPHQRSAEQTVTTTLQNDYSHYICCRTNTFSLPLHRRRDLHLLHQLFSTIANMSHRAGLRAFQASLRQVNAQFRQRIQQRAQTTAANPAVGAAPVQESWFQRMWNSPIGLKTVHFW